MSKPPVRFGLVGFGAWGRFHAQSIAGNPGARLAAITVIVVMVTGSLDPKLSPGLNALLRFVESCIGTGVAVLAVRLWPGSGRQGDGDS